MTEHVLIVGERINATRKRIGEALQNRDSGLIEKEARSQAEAGADYIDVNAGRAGANEPEDLSWLVEVVQEAVDKPLCLDSADPEALRAALGKARLPALVNSVDGDAARIKSVLELVVQHGASVIALTMEDKKMPESAADRMRIAELLADAAGKVGVPMSKVYFDPCVLAASTSPDQPTAVLETTREIKSSWPESHVICGLSNVSFGLPLRGLLNCTFTAMMMACGADAFILDPTDPAIRATIASAEVLAGRDEFGIGFIGAVREGKIS